MVSLRHFLARPSLLRHISLVLILCVAALVYLPGLSGPYLFDDYSNLLDNRFLRLEQFDFESVRRAAFSLNAGPLQRPVTMLSFAINAHLAGGFASPVSYRVINIAIHLLNGLLIYWLSRLVVERYRQMSTGERHNSIPYWPSPHLLSAAMAFLWLVHPINLTSVLYIVQRMTSLAALFTLLALISYLLGRLRIQGGRLHSGWILLAAVGPLGALGIFSKENALLIPVFVLLFDLILFRSEFPWNRWPRLTLRNKWLIASTFMVFTVALLFLAATYAAPNYSLRNFTMAERVLTESRVLVSYLSLIVAPRLDGFGLFHDDIALSRSLFDPPTTFLAICVLIGLAVTAVSLYRRAPLITLGVGWFFSAHLLESTIFPLEIAHEHRNYLASLALPFVLAGITRSKRNTFNHRYRIAIITAVGVCFATITGLRAAQWSSAESLYTAEVRHHPTSPAANAGLGITLLNSGRVNEAVVSLRRASELEPREAGTLINLTTITATYRKPVNQQDLDVIGARLAANPVSATTLRALRTTADCVISTCIDLAPQLERWIHILMTDNHTGVGDPAYYYQLLGRSLLGQQKLNEAIDAFRKSYEIDPNYVIPLFDIALIYLDIGHLRYAEIVAEEIRRANQRIPLPRHQDLDKLEHKLNEHRHTSK